MTNQEELVNAALAYEDAFTRFMRTDSSQKDYSALRQVKADAHRKLLELAAAFRDQRRPPPTPLKP